MAWPTDQKPALNIADRIPSAIWEELAGALSLSRREVQILRGVFDGADESELARDIHISPHTVHTYLGRLYRKLHVSNRAQLVAYVFMRYVTDIRQPLGPSG